MNERIVTSSEDETVMLGKRFASALKAGDVVALYGDLGSGKTQFVKGVCAGIGVTEHVTSPTFTLINEYRNHGGIPLFHLDLYRLRSFDEVLSLGIEEYLDDDGVSMIEWAEKAERILPREKYSVRFRVIDGVNRREILMQRGGA